MQTYLLVQLIVAYFLTHLNDDEAVFFHLLLSTRVLSYSELS